MPIPGYIPNHVDLALERLLQQFVDKDKVAGVISALTEQIQDLEDTFSDLFTNRTIALAVGQTLDDIGTIVGQPRLGFDDVRYRSLLLAKIGENVSQGDPEAIIQITKLLIGANLVHLQEYYPAGFGLSASEDVPNDLINFFYSRLDRVDPAGVRLEALICFDEADAFAFEGPAGTADGFGDDTAPAVGGMFGKLHMRTLPAFSFDGAENGDEGFGTLEDNLVGGLFQ
jgi:hypothetical protein